MTTNGYSIYMHKSPSDKVYIGQTCQKPERRWGKDGKAYLRTKKNGSYSHPLFALAILKYGWDNFEHKILFTGLSALDANLIEEDLVYYYMNQGLSYNVASGGNRLMTDEIRNKISNTLKGKPSPFKGKKHNYSQSEEFKHKQSERQKEVWNNSNYYSEHIESFLENGKNTRFKAGATNTIRSKPCIQMDLEGNIIAEYPSVAEACRQLGLKRAIEDCCRGKNKTAYGFKWKYKDE